MKHVDKLREDWAKHCRVHCWKYHDKTQALTEKVKTLQIERDSYVGMHEYNNVDMQDEEIEIAQKHLNECSPINFQEFAKREFAKDFKRIAGGHELTEQDRLFFKIYFYREYIGSKVNDVIKTLGINCKAYYKAYGAGMEFFFPEDETEEISEVG
jgi:hypothetical protein